MPDRFANSIIRHVRLDVHIPIETHRLLHGAFKRIKAEELADGRVVVPCPQVDQAIAVGPLAGEAEAGLRATGVAIGRTIGVVNGTIKSSPISTDMGLVRKPF
jgi:hypothetical protein